MHQITAPAPPGTAADRRSRVSARRPLHLSAAAALATLVVLSACEDTGSNPDPIDPPQVAGTWTGTYQVGGEVLAARFTFTQQGFVVGGTGSVETMLPPSPIEAAIGPDGRVVMLLENECEAWLGTMTVSSDETTMSGPLQVDRQQCPTGLNDAGGLNLTRQ